MDKVSIFCLKCDYETILTKEQFLFKEVPKKCLECNAKFEYTLDKNWRPLPDGINSIKEFKEKYLGITSTRDCNG